MDFFNRFPGLRNGPPPSVDMSMLIRNTIGAAPLRQRRKQQTLDLLKSPRLPSRRAPRTTIAPNDPIDLEGLLRSLLGANSSSMSGNSGGGGSLNSENGGTSIGSGGSGGGFSESLSGGGSFGGGGGLVNLGGYPGINPIIAS